ncbi:DUF4381 domain-containing protein [Photobacterium sp.]|uniref:DUF4381 domain-containing protein n=1 Tax=Photobacterium sp. TaxID=660 RepID=UPI00299EC994|nr:DUF4381 domain-containing protein [Photobacterium sp.]MDX1304352.1 DUF4381 domain-containing protein [Photobacterium sp.]
MADQTLAPLPIADIHLQAIPGIWPLAWGWWLCILFMIGGVFVAVRHLKQYRTTQQARKEALQQLKALRQTDRLGDINDLLRQAALSYFPRPQVAGLTGESWLVFLDQQLPAKHRGFQDHAELWQQGLFSPQGINGDDFKQCKRLASVWLTKALPPKKTAYSLVDSHLSIGSSGDKKENRDV